MIAILAAAGFGFTQMGATLKPSPMEFDRSRCEESRIEIPSRVIDLYSKRPSGHAGSQDNAAFGRITVGNAKDAAMDFALVSREGVLYLVLDENRNGTLGDDEQFRVMQGDWTQVSTVARWQGSTKFEGLHGFDFKVSADLDSVDVRPTGVMRGVINWEGEKYWAQVLDPSGRATYTDARQPLLVHVDINGDGLLDRDELICTHGPSELLGQNWAVEISDGGRRLVLTAVQS
jgi:hypothetical protein